MVFELGDDSSIDKGQLKIQTFTSALEALRTEVKVKNLRIHFEDFCWAATESADDFADALGKITVTGSLEISGPDFMLQENLLAIPQALGMKAKPEHASVNRSKGVFSTKYHPAKTSKELFAKEGEVIEDVNYRFHQAYAEVESSD